MCEHYATCPHTCPQQQVKKRHPIKSFVVQVVYLGVLAIPEMLLNRLAKARIKKAMIIQWNSMPAEQQLFFWQLSKKLNNKNTEA